VETSVDLLEALPRWRCAHGLERVIFVVLGLA